MHAPYRSIVVSKGGKQDASSKEVAGYLEIKSKKYNNPKLSDLHDESVKKCLAHITEVVKQLGIPLSGRHNTHRYRSSNIRLSTPSTVDGNSASRLTTRLCG